MNMLRRTVLATAAALALAPAAALAQDDTIKVGEINHYKRMAAFAEPYKMGIELALSEINADGGVLGKDLEFIFRDDQGDPAEAVKIAEELMTREGAVMFTGSILSHVGLALSSFANEKGYLYLAAEPLADSLVWHSGNPWTFRLRASTWVQAAMLAEEAAKTDAVTYATIAPNYAYGQDAVAAFKENLKRLKPEVEFVAEQWPALFNIDAGAEVQAIERAKPDAIYNVTFGTDLAKFVRQGGDRGLFDGRDVYGLLTGEPEYLDPLGEEAPEGWFVTGFPWYGFEDGTPGKTFVDAYMDATGETPKIGSLVGYMTAQSIAAAIETAGATDTDALRQAFEGLTVEDTPIGPLTYREIDNQSTLGAWVGTTALEDGKGVMVDWEYKDPAPYMPSDEEVTAMRPAE
ncbi:MULTISPECIES: ABC transporter substrate-binding protein [Salipiger]|jgi:branched-chain amino acid transport system substrate-binding protein|uniref:Amino acid/amide ABC transporter substrate-binding protein, HAAT family n=1 Tax=Salipiger profundus TaxID=1229727 RepID=A0A1U7D7S3_9RHOB|nr:MULTISPECIES: ABC transporter substrate-binding protein [Salipiger]APX24173.1 amino acid/amide ABC transporter substrate-binding protein, HAAT family [Salipiger profundus]GFZ95179.1 twin-arginine translocation pathway signal protein [Salipiger profundus]SFB88855.1 amino acid/amide ABC transporter substrate-binding protein, HAAT family [Salipiger profundus]